MSASGAVYTPPIGLRLKALASKIAFWFSVFVFVSPAILVFLWMLSLAFKTEVENMAFPPVFIPSAPTLANFIKVFEASPFALYTLE